MEPDVNIVSASTFFPRGQGPLVSVMLPTRGRSTQLLESVESCVNNAKDPSRLEFVIKVDEDDEETIDTIQILATAIAPIRISEILGPRGNGFLDIHHWYNKLMWPQAKGDWLLLWNDDSRMLTRDWDEIIRVLVTNPWHGSPGDVCALVPETNDNQSSNETVMVRRKSCEIMGHVFGSPYGDSWLLQVMAMVDSVTRLPTVRVEHKRIDCKEKNDSTRNDTDGGFAVGISSLQSVSAMLQKMADATKLLAHIQARESSVLWVTRPPRVGWYRWRLAIEERAINVFVGEGNQAILFDNELHGPVSVADMGGFWWPMLGE